MNILHSKFKKCDNCIFKNKKFFDTCRCFHVWLWARLNLGRSWVDSCVIASLPHNQESIDLLYTMKNNEKTI